MARAVPSGNQVKNTAEHEARKAADNPWTERLVRLGYAVRGIVYIIPGILALQLAMGSGGQATNPTGAIELMGSQPFGKVLLAIVAVGLAGYALWGLVRATLDPFREGDDAEGLAKRLGYIVSGFGYAVLLIATVQYMSGTAVSGNQPQDWSAKLLQQSWGRWLVGLIGLGWLVGGGFRQIYDGLRANMKERLTKLGPRERQLAIAAGRFGFVARGIVFGLIGLFLIQSAFFQDPAKAKGFDGALLTLARTPYGPWLLAVVAVGLIAFGLYSIMCARWMRVPDTRRSSR